ncbi:MAG: L-threonine 3-dehydrogenase [Fimbriimonadaceae bacterium]|nr:L-threonine 3-dehydrogenase [Fimbriimonadaceae bacterium]
MQALVLMEPGTIAMQEVAVPQPGPGEVLVRVKAATTCGTDLKAFLRGHPQIPMPGLFGHEYSGVVSAVGEDAKFGIGDEVMGVHSAPCQSCYWCINGQENLCEQIMATKVLGSYAEWLLIPKHIADVNLYPKPKEIDFDRAALLEPLACVVQGLEEASIKPDSRILILGSGAIGLMFVASLRFLGFKDITLSGRKPNRLALGEMLGAKIETWDDLPALKNRGFDVVIECTGSVEVWERSVDFVRRGGKVVLFGGCPTGSSVSFDTRRLHYDQISILSPFHFGTLAVRLAREWLLNPALNLSPLLSGERLLSEAQAVFGDLQRGTGIKYVFRP